jgi:ABC-type nitrate/sulfonate/bicarbonate transport system substrate-binding protein
MSRIGRVVLFAGLVAVSVSLGTPTSGQTPAPTAKLTPLKFAYLFAPGGFFTNFAVSQDQGFFREDGLDVSLIVPGSASDAIKLVASGEVQFGLGHSTDVILARSRGVPVVSVGTTHQFGTAGVMAPVEKGIRTPKDLEGKTVGITGIPANRVMLEQMLRVHNVDATKVRIIVTGFAPMPALLEGRIDALGDAITWYEPIEYNLAKGKDPNDQSTYTYSRRAPSREEAA